MMKPQINMIGIVTSNFNDMLLFYRDKLWFEVTYEMKGNYVEFKNEWVRFAITTHQVMKDATWLEEYLTKKHGHCLELAFSVTTPEEVDKSIEDLLHKWVTIIKQASDMPRGQRTAFFADPDGNVHEIFCDLPQQ